MRVLMFGWEFPPNISGGLGTACYGLSKALVENGVNLTFVVPSLHGNETNNGATVIGANDFIAPPSSDSPVVENKAQAHPAEAIPEVSGVHETQFITTISVSSSMSPYDVSHIGIHDVVQHWSHRMHAGMGSLSNEDVTERGASKINTLPVAAMKGGYGPGLTTEVYQYAAVAEQIVQKISVDVIHAHDWMTFPAAVRAKKISGRPLIVHVHATEFDRAGESGNPLTYRIEKEGLTEADRVVAVSQWTKDMLMSRYDIPDEKIQVVHNGIMPEDFSCEKQEHELGSDIVTFIGRVTYQKGPEYFARAAEMVLEKFPDAQFVMAGSGDMLPSMISLIAKKNMSSHFSFTGFLDKEQVNKLFSHSKVYVMPSVSEPFGILPLEAIQAGVPVIISRQSGVKEVMPHALTVDFWDTASLASAICSILEFDVLSNELRKNARQEIDRITWKKAAQKLNTLYHELIN